MIVQLDALGIDPSQTKQRLEQHPGEEHSGTSDERSIAPVRLPWRGAIRGELSLARAIDPRFSLTIALLAPAAATQTPLGRHPLSVTHEQNSAHTLIPIKAPVCDQA